MLGEEKSPMGFQKKLDVKVTPNNVTGGSAGSIGIAQAWDSAHDGYVIVATSETPLTVPVMTPFNKTSKDWKYFITSSSFGILAINAKKAEEYGIKNIQDLANYANKSRLKIAGTSGGLWFALSSLLTGKQYGNWSFNWISYGGSGDAIKSAVGGIDSDLVVASIGELSDYLRSGSLIALASMDTENYNDVPPITTVLPNLSEYFPLKQWLGVKIPADTPEDVVETLSAAFKEVIKTPEMDEFAKLQSADLLGLTGDEAQKMVEQSERSLAWILSDLGQTVNSPADVGIAR
ncbi:MAG: Bug family tripartite tricarboxylate transporter substrate binding protein [Brevinema sp.]